MKFSDVSSNERVRSYASIHQSRNEKANLSRSVNSVLRSSPKNKKVNQTKRDSRERKPIDKIMTTDLVDALGLRKNSTKD